MLSRNRLRSILILTILLFGLTAVAMAQDQEAEGQFYIVQHDDTLWKIAEKYLGDGNRYGEIIAATQVKHAEDSSFAQINTPNVIYAGSLLWIPAAGVMPETTSPGSSATPPSADSVASTSAAVQPASTAGSPAGQIAFSFWNNSPERCTYEINVINAAACSADDGACQTSRRIFALNNVSEPALSPDSNRLAFRGWGGIPEKHLDDSADHPYYGCPGPHAQRQLGHTTLDGSDYYRATQFYEDSHPDWSPDGSRLLFDTARNGDGITRLIAVSADGMYEEELRLAGQHPSWAPDNDRLVYRGCDLTGNRCGLWLARAIPVEAWDLGINLIGPVLEEAEAAHPDWSPVGEQIVYQSPANGSWDLYLINADGSNKQQLTNDPGIEGLPVWSPDGEWIAYLSDADGSWGIWAIRANGSERRLLFAFDGGIFTPKTVTPYFGRDWLDEQISWSR